MATLSPPPTNVNIYVNALETSIQITADAVLKTPTSRLKTVPW